MALFCAAITRDSVSLLRFPFLSHVQVFRVRFRLFVARSVCMLKSHGSLCVSFSRTGPGLCIYHLFVWSNLNFLHISQWITLPTQSCLALYSCANLLHSLIMWLIVLFLSPHSLHLLFCCVLSILSLIWLVLMALSCTAIRRDSVYPLEFFTSALASGFSLEFEWQQVSLLLLLLLLFYPLRVFHINRNWHLSLIIWWISFSKADSGLCIFHLSAGPNIISSAVLCKFSLL